MGTSEEAARRNVHEGLKRLRKEYAAMTDRRPLERALRAGAPPCHAPAAGSERRGREGRAARRRLRHARLAGRARCCWPPRPRPGARRLPRCDEEADAPGGARRARLATRPGRARRLDEPRRELDEYFAGRRRRFELALDWRLTRGFGRRVLRPRPRSPTARSSTYEQVAAARAAPRAPRGRQRAGRQPAADRRPLPPRAALGRRPGRLHRRPGAQAQAAGDRAGVRRPASVTRLTQYRRRSAILAEPTGRVRGEREETDMLRPTCRPGRRCPAAMQLVGHVDTADRVAGAPAPLRQAGHGAAALPAAVRDALGPGRHQGAVHGPARGRCIPARARASSSRSSGATP